ncbi:glycosyltransferase [Cohnella mopanensis]|uniref:glycosyltransferase n=1 Tax=Cohnella mopanensis TaxID=2911966 RepID=UPI003F7242E4
MIVKNEEGTLDRCLSSVRGVVDEIVIVDTGSTDLTRSIAAKYTDDVYHFEWVNDFSAARNYAFSLATKEYILWLDADDILLPGDAVSLRDTLSKVTRDVDAISMPYHLSFDEEGNVTSSLRRNRIVKREKGFRWVGQVHEYLAVGGNIHESMAAVTHKREHTQTRRNLTIYEEREEKGERFSARDLYYYGNELKDHGLWERAIDQYERFLEYEDGWVEDRIAACGKMADGYHALGRTSEARQIILKSFTYSSPRPINCCKLGSYHMEEGDYAGAVGWYEQALHIPSSVTSAAYEIHGYRNWVPHLQLCVCYDRLQMTDLARMHNEKAAAYVPNHESVRRNRAYFEGLNLSESEEINRDERTRTAEGNQEVSQNHSAAG